MSALNVKVFLNVKTEMVACFVPMGMSSARPFKVTVRLARRLNKYKNYFALIALLLLLQSCGLAKAVDYSFYVPEHGEYEINGKCYGIENQPGERLLITDCGGYINVLVATFTLGLSISSERISKRYKNAIKAYLDSNYENCEINKVIDLGGRIFEVFYSCKS